MKFYNIIVWMLIFLVISCKEKVLSEIENVSSPLYSEKVLMDKKIDTIFLYHQNGKIKEKGCLINKNRIGWWETYDNTGKLIEKAEFIIRNDSSYLNQQLYFLNNGKIDYSRSSFFDLVIRDTIKLGKSVGKLVYHTNPRGYKTRFVYIFIENEYSEKLSKTDTFTDEISKLWFGVNACKKGKLKLKGKIEEELSFVNLQKDSSEITIKKHYKYFEKDLYVE